MTKSLILKNSNFQWHSSQLQREEMRLVTLKLTSRTPVCCMRGAWQPSTKLDFRRNRIWTIPHIWGAHCLHTHQISWQCFDLEQIYATKTPICCRRLPNWIFEGNVFRPFNTSRELITYIPTKCRKKYFDRGKDIPRKRNSKRALWRWIGWNSTSSINFDKYHLSETFLCMILQRGF